MKVLLWQRHWWLLMHAALAAGKEAIVTSRGTSVDLSEFDGEPSSQTTTTNDNCTVGTDNGVPDHDKKEEEEEYDEEDEFWDRYYEDYYDEEEDDEDRYYEDYYDEEEDDEEYDDEEEEEEEEPIFGPWLPGESFGAIQILDHGTEEEYAKALAKLDDTYSYITTVVMAVDTFEKVRDLCYNHNEMCTQWAVEGECKNNPNYMNKFCAPSCRTCHLLHYEVRCMADPRDPVAWEKPGDLNRMFERIVRENNAHVWSRPNYAPEDENNNKDSGSSNDYFLGPWIVSIEDFISDEEAERLIYHGKLEGYERSEGVGEIDEETGETEPIVFEERTSTNAWCGAACMEDPIVEGVLKRIENLTGVPMENSESLQLLHYDVGQYYETHSDYIEREWNAVQGPRIMTVYIYLNDTEEGGETRFDWFDLKVKPKRGRVVIWPNVLDEDPTEVDERTEHEAMPVIKGQKFGANAWIHLRSRIKAEELDC